MQREIFTGEHEAFRDMVRAFIAREITPYHEQWERDGVVSRDVWLAAGRAGLLGIHIDEKYGGGGDPDYRYYVVLNEELARAGATGPMFQLHNDMIGPYLDRLCTPEQRERWLPGYCSGEIIAERSQLGMCILPKEGIPIQLTEGCPCAWSRWWKPSYTDRKSRVATSRAAFTSSG